MKHKQNYKVFQLNNAKKHESTRNPQKKQTKSEQQKYC